MREGKGREETSRNSLGSEEGEKTGGRGGGRLEVCMYMKGKHIPLPTWKQEEKKKWLDSTRRRKKIYSLSFTTFNFDDAPDIPFESRTASP